jgi:hypothetical protein
MRIGMTCTTTTCGILGTSDGGESATAAMANGGAGTAQGSDAVRLTILVPIDVHGAKLDRVQRSEGLMVPTAMHTDRVAGMR